jgi:transposase-like protein
MADELRRALLELLRKAQMEEDADVLREGVRVLSQALMEMELSQQLGARRYERTPERTDIGTATGIGRGTLVEGPSS